MTSFGDVNVGDKVRLTDSDGEEHVIRVYAVAPTVGDDWAITGNHGTYHSDNWSAEVLEPAPKPLPKEPGLYFRAGVAATNPTLWSLERHGGWITDSSGEWEKTAVDDVPADLVRLVPESAVEEARAEVVKEIVKFLYRHDDRSWDVAANKVDLTFGGKA